MRGRSRAFVVLVALVAMVAGGCAGDAASAGGAVRRVLVDYKHDEFSASFLAYFPNLVQVHPGDRVDFRQAWTGEPHTVTMGRLVDELGAPFWERFDPIFERGDADFSSLIGIEPPVAPAFFEQLPPMANAELEVVQAAAQPCYLREGVPDTSDPSKPCAEQEQPEFDGRYDYYNSGFIPYEGDRGNTFTIPLADDIAPGTYHYYCNLHSVEMSGAIEVVPEDRPIATQTDVNKAANRQATRYTDELETMFTDARNGDRGELPTVGTQATKQELDQQFGLFPAIGNEFIPSTIETAVGEKVTWSFRGRSHSIAVNAPRYFPVVGVEDDGDVRLDPRGLKAVSFPVPPDQASLEAGGPPPSPDAPPRPPVHLDGGRFDGTGGLRSTGMFYAEGDTFSLTFTKRGTYLIACLVHPAMVGKVVVR